MLFLLIFSFYAYAFYIGGMLRWNKVENRGDLYKSGVITAIMFSTIFGAFGLGGAVPHIKAITEGRVAGKLA